LTTPNQSQGLAWGTDPTIQNILGPGAFVIGSTTQNWGQNFTEDIIKVLIAGPAGAIGKGITGVESMIEAFAYYLIQLPLEVLQQLEQFLPPWMVRDFTTLEAAVESIMRALNLGKMGVDLQEFTRWLDQSYKVLETELHQIFDIINGVVITPITSRLHDFQTWWAATGIHLPGSISDASSAVSQLSSLIAGIAGATSIADVATAIEGSVSKFSSLISGIGGATITDVVNLLLKIQQLIDTLHNLVIGGSSTGNSISQLLSGLQSSLQGLLPAFLDNGDGTLFGVSAMADNGDGTITTNAADPYSIIETGDGTLLSAVDALRNIAGQTGSNTFSVGNWQSLLSQTGTQNAENLASSLSGLLPAVIHNGDGTLTGLGSQVIDNLDGTVSYVTQEVGSGTIPVSTMIDNLDGTIMPISETVQNAVSGAEQIGSNFIQGVSGIFGHLFGGLSGHSSAPAASPAQSYAALQGLAATTQTNTIQLGGVSGLNVLSVNQALQRSGVSVTGGSSGVNTATNFTGLSNANTVTGFTVGAFPSQSAYYEQDMGIQSGQVAWTYGSAGNTVAPASPYATVTINPDTAYTYLTSEGAYIATPTTTDYQVVSMVMNTANQINGANTSYIEAGSGFNYLVARVNSAADTCVYAKIGFGHAVLACVVSGSQTVFTTVNHTAVMNATYELQVGNPLDTDPYFIALYCNGTTIASYDDSGHVSQYGSSYRLAGFGMASEYVTVYGNGILMSPTYSYYPATVSYWAYQDNLTPSAVGSGFRAYRASTTNATLSSGKNLLPNSFFDTTQYITGDMTYASGTNNTLTVTVAGWYIVKICINLNTSSATGSFIGASLYRNGSVAQQGSSFYIPAAPWTGPTGDTFVLYCASGDTLQPGAWASALSVNGEATGTQCYWEVTLANCGTLS